MFIDSKSLKQHLKGHDVPRFVIGQVLEELNKLRNLDTKVVYQELGSFKARLASIAEHESLSNRQRSLVGRSHYCLYGNGTTQAMQIAKDLTAINTPVSDGEWQAIWPTTLRGARDFGKVDRLSADQVQPIYQILFTKFDKVKTEQFPKDAELTKQTHLNVVVQKSRARFSKELSQWSVLPAGIKALPVWDRVFAGIHLSLVERDEINGSTMVGTIGTDQEPGMKLRLFASPYLMYQSALEPLKRHLQRICSNIPQDCHKDQESGAKWAQLQLMNNHTVYSFDLSSATHRFPWGMQLKLLQHLGVPKVALDLFEHVAKGGYQHNNEFLQWVAGQPLGSGPSFFAFSLAHHALVRGICADLSVDVDCYRMLGDDIVIANDKVARRYEAYMTKIGAVINSDKSLVSKTNAEFAGFIITATQLYRTGKMRAVHSNNWLQYASEWSNREDLPRNDRETIETLTGFNSYKPDAVSNLMTADVHRFISSSQANAAAENLSIPETFHVWDFATSVASSVPQRKDSCRSEFYTYYKRKMDKLGEEIISYLPPSDWNTNIADPSVRITSGIRELLDILGSCPTQCEHPWAVSLMSNRGGKPTFMRVRRTLIQLATAYRLVHADRWLLDGTKFATKLNKWHKEALVLQSEGLLEERLESLKVQELSRWKNKLTQTMEKRTSHASAPSSGPHPYGFALDPILGGVYTE